ncbi:hypothetical protein EDB85DRAFT_2155681 [Lactarius pseudohatsudake]|nr:hypothetical protein EDB85DRAFT_2155681 [Lactarius pseudohatsudake]
MFPIPSHPPPYSPSPSHPPPYSPSPSHPPPYSPSPSHPPPYSPSPSHPHPPPMLPIPIPPPPTPMFPIPIPPTPTPMFPIPISIPPTPSPMFRIPISIPPTPSPMFPILIPPTPTPMFPIPISIPPTPSPMFPIPISIPPTPSPMFPIPIPPTPTPMFPILIPPTPTPMFPILIPPTPTPCSPSSSHPHPPPCSPSPSHPHPPPCSPSPSHPHPPPCSPSSSHPHPPPMFPIPIPPTPTPMFPILIPPTPTPMFPILIPPTPTPMFPISIPPTPTPMFPILIPPTPTPMFPIPIPPTPTLVGSTLTDRRPILATFLRLPFLLRVTHQELVDALASILPASYHDGTNNPATYWLMSEDGQRLNAAPLTRPKCIGFVQLSQTVRLPHLDLSRYESNTGRKKKTPTPATLRWQEWMPAEGGDQTDEDPAAASHVHRDAASAVYEQPELELRGWYPAEHPDLLTARDSDALAETPYACDSMGRPIYRGDVRIDAPPLHPTIRLQRRLGSAAKPPTGYKVNKADDFVHYLITDAQGITRQAAYVQVVMAADPRVIALVDDSDKVYSKPLYAEPMVRERGKPHYTPEDLVMFAVGHANRHRVDMAVNELRDVSAKAELHRFRAYTQEAERIEQHLHHLALTLGEVKGELARSKFRLEMADIVERIGEKQQGWMGGVRSVRRRGRRS